MTSFSEAQLKTLLKSYKIKNSPPILVILTPLAPEMASLSNSRWQKRKERPNLSTNNRNMNDKVKHKVVR